MTKSELIEKMSADAGISKAAAEKCLAAFIDGVKETLKSGDKLSLVGFGTFEAKARSEREGFNPLTKEKITVAACTVPAFKASKAFKDELN